MNKKSYTIDEHEYEPSITCLICKTKSFNENDIKYKYCGHCHRFHDDGKGRYHCVYRDQDNILNFEVWRVEDLWNDKIKFKILYKLNGRDCCGEIEYDDSEYRDLLVRSTYDRNNNIYYKLIEDICKNIASLIVEAMCDKDMLGLRGPATKHIMKEDK